MGFENNNFTTIGHQTFENRGGEDVKHAPYKCSDVNAFLGRGYYFWEDNLPFAKHWGGIWYINLGKKYFVGEFTIKCEIDSFFDLVGNRTHQKTLRETAKLLAKRRAGLSAWPIGKIIEFLKAASKDPDDIFFEKFDYLVIRAADDTAQKTSEKYKFADNKYNSADLNPCYIICVLVKNEILSSEIAVVHTSN
jgi:hypothetical protein